MSSKFTKSVRIINRKGLHARASAKLAKLALELPEVVTISFEGESADSRSIMDLLCLGAGLGSEVILTASGVNAEAAVETVEALFMDGFGELAEDEACAK